MLFPALYGLVQLISTLAVSKWIGIRSQGPILVLGNTEDVLSTQRSPKFPSEALSSSLWVTAINIYVSRIKVDGNQESPLVQMVGLLMLLGQDVFLF
jgi:hypothetical protein